MTLSRKLEIIHEVASKTLEELPLYPCNVSEMTERERKITRICEILCGAMKYIEEKSRND
jgi:hypothetical protein